MLPCACSVIDYRWRQQVVKTKTWHTSRGRVCNWCLTTFWHHRWSTTKQTHGNMEFIHFIQRTEKKKTNLLCRLTVQGLCRFRHFPSHKRYYSSVLLRFVLNLLVDSLSQTLFKVFTCSKQNNSANICRTASLSWRWHLMAIDVKMPSSLSIFAKDSFLVLFSERYLFFHNSCSIWHLFSQAPIRNFLWCYYT